MKKKVFEATFPLHEVSLGKRSHERWGHPWGTALHPDRWGQRDKAPAGVRVTPVFLYLISCSALQKEEVREFLKERWARWRDIFSQQPLEKIR